MYIYINCLEDVQCQIFFSVNYLPLMSIVLLDKLVVVQQFRFLKFWVTVVFIMVYKSLLWDGRNSVCNLLVSLRAILISTYYLHTLHLHIYIFKIHYIIVLSTPHLISSGLILILSCYINRCLTRGLFASVFTTTTVYAHLTLFMQVTCPTHLFLLDFKIQITHG